MNINEKYLDTLKKINDWVTVSEWAEKVAEFYPDLLKQANKQAKNHSKNTNGLKELSARISSALSTDKFKHVEIDDSTRPRIIRYSHNPSNISFSQTIINSDLEPLNRKELIDKHTTKLSAFELYRISEFYSIRKSLKEFFFIDFEVDHAKAILNPVSPGTHHPDNLQLLIKFHNTQKNNDNWKRFTFEEQEDYIKKVVELQLAISIKKSKVIDNNALISLLDRLKLVY